MKQFIKCPECGTIQILDIASLRYSIKMQYCEKCNFYFNSDIRLEPLKALSIQQPWATLIAECGKDIENRAWNTKFRGTILIHASKKFDYSIFHTKGKLWELYEEHIGAVDFEKGGIIGYVDIVDCVEKSDSPWFFGPKGFVLKNPGTLPFQPCKGKLSFFYPEIE